MDFSWSSTNARSRVPHRIAQERYTDRVAKVDAAQQHSANKQFRLSHSSWYRQKSFIKGVQIIYWLRLVCEHYPDLEATLTERFPRLELL
jgi:hypothetical protein